VRANEKGVILYVSTTCRALGYEPDDLVGRSAVELVHPEDRARFIANTTSVYRGGVATGEARVHRFRRKDGSWVWLLGHPRKLPSSQSQAQELVNFFEPVSPETAIAMLQA
jgi:PAS domain S-box-containing protein